MISIVRTAQFNKKMFEIYVVTQHFLQTFLAHVYALEGTVTLDVKFICMVCDQRSAPKTL
jgi:hypothetical protein